MSVKTYTDRYKGFQIRDCNYIGDPPTDIPPTFDVVKWEQHSKPIEVTDGTTGEKKMITEYCYSVGRLIYDRREPCFDFESVGLRWLEEHPSKDVENWITKWCKYKIIELNKKYE